MKDCEIDAGTGSLAQYLIAKQQKQSLKECLRMVLS